MKYCVGVTDYNWFDFLRQEPREDINFWKPLSDKVFAAVPAGAPFLLMLRKPCQCIVGVGCFMSRIALPVPIAWGAFGVRNGAADYESFARAIRKYPAALDKPRLHDPGINCLVLSTPVLFRKPDWIPAPASLGNRVYDTKEAAGSQLWAAVSATMLRYRQDTFSYEPVTDSLALVTQAHNKRCAISGEKILPVLEATHIQLSAQAGPNSVGNGLLRSNLHKLFDRYCITIDADDKAMLISPRIREKFSNGKEYQRFHGEWLQALPNLLADQPAQQYLQRHNERFSS